MKFVELPPTDSVGVYFLQYNIMEKKAFLFYLNWKDQIDELDDQELRRLINNLIKYHLDEDIELPTKADRLVWNGILPALESNQDKYEKRVQANRQNGKLGGAPKGNQNASKEKTTQINPEQPKQPDKREKSKENSKMENENREQVNENREEINENNKLENETDKTQNQVKVSYNSFSSNNTKTSSGISLHEFYKQRGLYN